MLAKKSILLFIAIAIVLCFLSVFVFTMPAFAESLNLSDASKGNIGTVIGGLTAPILGIFSTVLLVLTLNKQIESINDQKLRNESDLIFSLINQFDKEIESFYFTYNVTKGNERNEIKLTGIEGLNEFTRQFRYGMDLEKQNMQFGHFMQSNQILLLVHSFKLIQKRIEFANLVNEVKFLFQQKLTSVYDCRLHFPLKKVYEGLEKFPHLMDNASKELGDFYLIMGLSRTTPSYEV